MKDLFSLRSVVRWSVGLAIIFTFTPPAAAGPLPKSVVCGAMPVGSLTYVFAAAFGKVVAAHTPMTWDVFPESSAAWYPMMDTGEVHVGISMPDDFSAAYKGEETFKKPTKGKGFEFRTIMHGTPVQLALLVPGASEINKPQDIKGKRMPVNYGTQFPATLTAHALLANYGLSPSDVKGSVVTDYPEGVKALMEGRVDISFGSVGSGIVEELKAAKGARYLPLDTSSEAVARMQKIFPGYYAIEVKPGPAGITNEMHGLGKDICLLAAKSLSEDAVYLITKAIWENYQELAPMHPRLKLWTPGGFATTHAVVPYHSGSIKLYKEKGAWTKELEQHQERLLAIKQKVK